MNTEGSVGFSTKQMIRQGKIIWTVVLSGVVCLSPSRGNPYSLQRLSKMRCVRLVLNLGGTHPARSNRFSSYRQGLRTISLHNLSFSWKNILVRLMPWKLPYVAARQSSF